MEINKKILDVCCGGKMFYFDKQDERVLFCDKRIMNKKIVGNGKNARFRECIPDIQCDFTNLPFEDNIFYQVIFDPPHLIQAGKNSYLAQIYGTLDKNWQQTIKDGFNECMRVLKPNGTLIFKWNETQITVKQILKEIKYKPIFGNRSGKASKTHYLVFMKGEFNGK